MKTLDNITTCELVQELEKREGVQKTTAEPYQNISINIDGPAVVLVITD